MSNSMNMQALTAAGLSPGEGEVYLVLLRLNSATASEVARHTRIARPNVYDYLHKLKEKELVSISRKDGKTAYQPSSPEKLMDQLDQKRETVQKELQTLMALYNSKKESPKIEIYEGASGIRFLMKDIVAVGKDFVGWGGSNRLEEFVPEHLVKRYLEDRKKKGIRAKLLYVEKQKVLKTSLTEFKAIPIEYSSPNTTLIYGEKVAIILYTKIPTVILIQNSELAKSYSEHFRLMWKQST